LYLPSDDLDIECEEPDQEVHSTDPSDLVYGITTGFPFNQDGVENK